MRKKAALAAILAMVPIATSAETKDEVSFPRSRTPHIYVRERTSIDVALPPHISVTSNPVTADKRWDIATAGAGDVVHLFIHPMQGVTDQLLTIYAADRYNNDKTMHILLSSGPAESTANAVTFTASAPTPVVASWRMPAVSYRPAPSVTPAPHPQPTPRVLAVQSCRAPMDSKYHWSGDRRIDVWQTCDDGKHVFVIMREGRNPPGAVLYRVDAAGHQDQLMNASFVPGTDDRPPQWVADGTPDSMALVSDTSRGQMRVNIEHGK